MSMVCLCNARALIGSDRCRACWHRWWVRVVDRAADARELARAREPSAESLAEMPEINDERLTRIPGHGYLASHSCGDLDDEPSEKR